MVWYWLSLIGIVLTFNTIFATEIKLKGESIYRVQNRENTRLYLTAIGVKKSNVESPIIADTWRGSATQKWRLISVDPSLALIQLRPTSDESHELSIDSQNASFVSQSELHWYNRIGISNAIHQWRVTAVEEGYVQLRNYKTGQCLQSSGIGRQVGIGACVNSLRQQWLLDMM